MGLTLNGGDMGNGAGDGEKRKGRPCRFGRPLREYVEVYGAAVRTIKQWVRRGDDVGEPVPLDDPVGMVRWWERWMKKRVPEEIWKAAGPLAEMAAVTPKEEKVVHVPKADEKPGEVVMPEGIGLEAELGRLEILAARLSVTAHEPGQARNYTAAVSQMSILSRRMREELERERRLLPREEVERFIHEFHGPIEREVRLLVDGMGEAIGVPVTPLMREAWNRLCDETFSRMGEEVLR